MGLWYNICSDTKYVDMHFQHFHNLRTDDVNHNKCTITNTCIQHTYGVNAYLYQINSPKIRTIFTKLRKDSNSICDSRYRSYRGEKGENNLCPHCDIPHDVLHVLIRCDYPGVKKKRESLWCNMQVCKKLHRPTRDHTN